MFKFKEKTTLKISLFSLLSKQMNFSQTLNLPRKWFAELMENQINSRAAILNGKRAKTLQRKKLQRSKRIKRQVNKESHKRKLMLKVSSTSSKTLPQLQKMLKTLKLKWLTNVSILIAISLNSLLKKLFHTHLTSILVLFKMKKTTEVKKIMKMKILMMMMKRMNQNQKYEYIIIASNNLF